MSAYEWLRQPSGSEHFILCKWDETKDVQMKIRAYANQFEGKVKLISLHVQDPKTGESFKLTRCIVLKPCRQVGVVGRPRKKKRDTTRSKI